MSGLPSYDLELKAADERRRLHVSVASLREQLTDTFDVQKNLAQHLGVASGVVALIGLAAGYSLAGMFMRDRD